MGRAPPYPGSRWAGGMVDYQFLPLPADLVERFKTCRRNMTLASWRFGRT